MTNCILTCVLDYAKRPQKYKKIADLTIPFFERYATQCDADFRIIEERKHTTSAEVWRHNAFEKIQSVDYLDQYSRILFIDIDCYISKNCINLFDFVPENKFGITIRPAELYKEHNLLAKSEWEQATGIDWVAGNSGVFMLNQQCKIIKEQLIPELKNIKQGGQSFIASVPAHYGIEYFDLYPYKQSHQINLFVDKKINKGAIRNIQSNSWTRFVLQDAGIIHAMGNSDSKLGRLKQLVNKFEGGQ